jgi:mRNA interferase RelE/StbE
MASYKVVWRTSAERELRKLPREVITLVVELAATLAIDPFQHGAVKLAGAEHTWRVRSGDYRLIYSVTGDTLVVEIVKVGHRREVYR